MKLQKLSFIKKDRECFKCEENIKKGSSCFTSSLMYSKRVWFCNKCVSSYSEKQLTNKPIIGERNVRCPYTHDECTIYSSEDCDLCEVRILHMSSEGDF